MPRTMGAAIGFITSGPTPVSTGWGAGWREQRRPSTILVSGTDGTFDYSGFDVLVTQHASRGVARNLGSLYLEDRSGWLGWLIDCRLPRRLRSRVRFIVSLDLIALVHNVP